MQQRELTGADKWVTRVDQGLRVLFGRPETTGRPNPAAGMEEPVLEEQERRVAAGLMRVNHAGEVAAQGLYQGQALTARLARIRESMERAAEEENDHLAWCEGRLEELDSHVSRLGPFWYFGSFFIGAAAGVAGDRWSLGFVAETERQVVRHLGAHLTRLPETDSKSRAIVDQMRLDEGRHATSAVEAGARELPGPVKGLMRGVAGIMTSLAFYL